MKVLLVCSGNTCRSPMAAAILRKLAQDSAVQIDVDSCGLDAIEGKPAWDQAIKAMSERGLDLTGHRTKPFKLELAQEADLILTMEAWQRDRILQKWPSLASKTFTLSGFAQDSTEDVDDPFGQPLEEYRRTADKLQQLLELALNRIRAQTSREAGS
ncbi:MAG: low molecular weight protein arginine phosphatase [Bacillota bacterium]